MILKAPNRPFPYARLGKVLIGILVLAGLAWFISLFLNRSKTKPQKGLIYCDAETVRADSFLCNELYFTNGDTQSSEKSFNGKFSSKVSEADPYSFSIQLSDFVIGDTYKISVWRNTNSPTSAYLAVSSNLGADFYVSTTTPEESRSDGWEKVQLEFQIPDKADLKWIKVVPYVVGEGAVAYFDDLSIEHIPVSNSDPETEQKIYKLYLDNKALKKLNAKRVSAIKKGILKTEDDDWVKGKLEDANSKELDVKLRLKGDWTDHLKSHYWSFRVKTQTEDSWRRLKTFSFQHPKTRHYLYEYVYHKILEYEDILAPRYGFVNIKINDDAVRLYAYEEHFDKQIVEFKDRREGVIVKLGENTLWDIRIRDREHHIYSEGQLGTAYKQAEIQAFKEKRMLADTVLYNQYVQARKLLYNYQHQVGSPAQIFDLDKMAKYHALAEVMQAYHNLVWHNQRYYYNPFINKLEPIGFDGYTEEGVFNPFNRIMNSAYASRESTNPYAKLDAFLYGNPAFAEAYAKYLSKYSQSEFLDKFFSEIDTELSNARNQLSREFPKVKFDKKVIYKHARKIQATMKPVNPQVVQAFRSNCNGDSCIINISNGHLLPVRLVSSGRSSQAANSHALSVHLNSFHRDYQEDHYTTIKVPVGHSHLQYQVLGLPDKYTIDIKSWDVPDVSTRKELELNIPIDSAAYSIDNNVVHIHAGEYEVKEAMIIPKGYRLFIDAGTSINITSGAYIHCQGPVNFSGSKSNPIKIYSSDKNNKGIFISEADEISTVTHCSFTGLDTREDKDIRLTGALSFYESEVELSHVSITDNTCEDALNIIRSKFQIEYLNVSNTFGDGFDADFCRGTISKSRFYNTGNDAIDFSGSKITINELDFEKVSDKAISAGEASTLNVNDVNVVGADIGIASKDLSNVTVSNIDLVNCNKGFAAYKKKPEYGGGNITVKKYTVTDVGILQLADEESKIKLPE